MNDIQNKLKSVLNNLNLPRFKVDCKQLKTIINNAKEEASLDVNLTQYTQLYNQWMINLTKTWEENVPTKQIIIFYLELLTQVSHSKTNCIHLHQNGVYNKTIQFLNEKKYYHDNDVTIHYLTFLNSLTSNDFGRNWITSSFHIWKSIFELKTNDLLVNHIAGLINALYLNIMSNELFVIDLTQTLLQPIIHISDKINAGNIDELDEMELYQELGPIVKLLGQAFLTGAQSVSQASQWYHKNSKIWGLKKTMYDLLHVIKNEEFLLHFSLLLLPLPLIKINDFKPNDFLMEFINNTVNLININVNKKCYKNMVHITHRALIFWKHFRKIIDFEKFDFQRDFPIELVIFNLMPLSSLGSKVLGYDLCCQANNDILREMFLEKVFDHVDISIMKDIYTCRNILMEEPNLLEESKLSLQQIMVINNTYTKERVMFIFIYLVYLFGDVVQVMNNTGSLSYSIYDEEFVSLLIQSIHRLAQDYSITWKDGAEVIQVLKTTTDFLQNQTLSSNLVVKSLNLLELSITKYMAPCLALLMDTDDPSLSLIGSSLEKKLDDENVDVRYAALQALLTIAENSKIKYPYFRKTILKYNLHKKLLDLVLDNDKALIKLIALKCLQHLVSVKPIWQLLLERRNLLDILIQTLKNETDNSLRAELVNLITVIYEEDYFFREQKHDLYDVMHRLGVHDFEVNVRVNVLHFWDKVIKKLQGEEGMIDNEFPEVTFSKNSRKIVILDQVEINKRLKILMEKLCKIGCLAVFLTAYRSKEEMERSSAERLVKELMDILEKYNILRFFTENDDIGPPSLKKMKLSDMEPENLTPGEFLRNIMQPNTEEPEEQEDEFCKNLNEILGNNGLSEIDMLFMMQ